MEKRETKIIKCKDCKHRRCDKVYGYGSESKVYWCDYEGYNSYLGSQDEHYCSRAEKKD